MGEPAVMVWVLDLILVLFIVWVAFIGYRRGVVLILFELLAIILATITALWLFHPLGRYLQAEYHVSLAIANVAMFALVWVLVEITLITIVHTFLIHRSSLHASQARYLRILAGVLNGSKAALLILVALIVVSGLPIDDQYKKTASSAHISKVLLAAGSSMHDEVNGTLGRDISDTLTILRAPAAIEDDRAVDLGFSVIGKPDEDQEDAMLVLINAEREKRELNPLAMSQPARAVARDYSVRMLADGYFSHRDKRGRGPFERLGAAKVPYGAAGENLALAPSLEEAHKGLMDSPGHRANILSSTYRNVGIGIIDAGPYGLMVTQEFTD